MSNEFRDFCMDMLSTLMGGGASAKNLLAFAAPYPVGRWRTRVETAASTKPAVISSTGGKPRGGLFFGANFFLVVSRLTHNDKPRGGLIPPLRFASPTGLVPVACVTDYQVNTTPTTGRLHGACPRGYHD